MTCDLRKAEGQQLFRRLAAQADVLCENFRPGTMEEWGLGPSDLGTELVYVRISAFGQDGPYALRPGLDRLGIAYGGLLQLTGERDRPPVRPGVTISDYLTGVFAALGAVAGLFERRNGSGPSAAERHRRRALRVGPPGARVDARRLRHHRTGAQPRGEPDGQLRAARQLPRGGRILRLHRGRLGCQLRPSRAGRWVAPSSSRTRATPPSAARVEHGQEINDLVAAWAGGLGAAEIEAACVEHGVPVGTAYTSADIFADPHMAARGDLVDDRGPGDRTGPPAGAVPAFRGPADAGAGRRAELGAHNREVWCELVGLSADELEHLGEAGVV